MCFITKIYSYISDNTEHTLSFAAPAKPIIKISECSAVNNTVTLSWAAPPLSRVDAYILELDDGSKGPFRVSAQHIP